MGTRKPFATAFEIAGMVASGLVNLSSLVSSGAGGVIVIGRGRFEFDRTAAPMVPTQG